MWEGVRGRAGKARKVKQKKGGERERGREINVLNTHTRLAFK